MNTAKNNTDLWGQDIALDGAGEALLAGNGELILTNGVETGVQDIRLRLLTRLETLFYDVNFGSLIYDWFFEESSPDSREALLAEIVLRVEQDPRVRPGTVWARVLSWDSCTVQVAVEWFFIASDQPSNLVLQADKVLHELLIKDVSYGTDQHAVQRINKP